MKAYQPAEHEETRSVAPLLQFFELVHVGDMMQSMIQVYFDKELVRADEGINTLKSTDVALRFPISIVLIS